METAMVPKKKIEDEGKITHREPEVRDWMVFAHHAPGVLREST
jgi:hypothetical protein